MSFKTINIGLFYSTDGVQGENILTDFYIPVLSEAISYKRIVAYFSSKSFAYYARGLIHLVNNGGKAIFIISPQLSPDDLIAIEKGYRLRGEEILIEYFLATWQEPSTPEELEPLSYLSWMIMTGKMEILIGLPTSQRGILHKKIGLLEDSEGNKIAFSGSANETGNGLFTNLENIDVFLETSNEGVLRIERYERDFNRYINNDVDSELSVIAFPDALKKKIISYGIKFGEMNQMGEQNDLFLKLSIQQKNLEISISPSLRQNRLLIDSINFVIHKFTDNNKAFADNNLFILSVVNNNILQDIVIELKKCSEELGFELVTEDEKLIEILDSLLNQELSFKDLLENAEKIRNGVIDKNEFVDFRNTIDSLFVRKLREYQFKAAYYASKSIMSCNFSVPGSGKTSISYATFAYLNNLPKDNNHHVEKMLVIGPISSFSPWDDEFDECFGRKRIKNFIRLQNVHYSRIRKYFTNIHVAEITVINYEKVIPNIDAISTFLKKFKTLLVIDESHRIKNPFSQRSMAVRMISKYATSRLLLTGTPMPNGYEDLEPQLNLLWPDKNILQTTYYQLKEYTKLANSSLMIRRNIKEFQTRINPFFIRITKKMLQIPEPEPPNIYSIAMSKAENEIYSLICQKKMEIDPDDNIMRKLILARVIRQMQAASNPKLLLKPLSKIQLSEILNSEDDFEVGGLAIYDPLNATSQQTAKTLTNLINQIPISTKMNATLSKIKDLVNQNKKVVVWSVFVQNMRDLKENLYLQYGIKSELLFGENRENERDEFIDLFKQRNSDLMVLIANPSAVSESISLHKICHDAIYFELSYNAIHFIQSKDRIHRLGLAEHEKTNYHFFQSINTIDQSIYNRLLLKEARMNSIIENELPPLFSDQASSEILEDLAIIEEKWVK